jgi:hypothetical protein
MMHVRFNLITADPARLGDALKYIETEVFPEVESQPGSLGLSLYKDQELGLGILESIWASDDSMHASEHMATPSRAEAVRRAAGTVSVERFQLPVFEQDARPWPGAAMRLIRMDIEPSDLEDGVDSYGDTAVAELAETEGFRSALLLADPLTGHCLSETIWANAEHLAASRSVAAAVRVDLADEGYRMRAVEEYELVYSTARKA